MLNIFLGQWQTSLGWMPSVHFRFKVTTKSKVKQVHFIQNIYEKMRYGMFSLNNCIHFDTRATVLNDFENN